MSKPTGKSYTFSHRFQGVTRLELFDRYYLRVKEKKLRGGREFKLELAILNPQPIKVENNAIHWLAAAGLSGLAAVYLLYLLFVSNPESTWFVVAGLLAMIFLSGLFAVLYAFTAEHKWVLETRASAYPLVEVPYHRKEKEAAQRFVQMLQVAIGKNIAGKGYDNEVLFAGEMRMLRRLAHNHVLSIDAYDRAKKHMLEKSGHMGVVS